MELFIVHSAPVNHLYTQDAMYEIRNLRPGQVISDSAAQTIAAWWHAPSKPLTTVLSTRGQVDIRMNRETFASDDNYLTAENDDRRALDALAAYITDKIARAESGYRHCACRDCMDAAVGIPGAFCNACEDAECEYDTECDRDDAYGDDDPEDECEIDCTCIHCIPGA